jgi:tRNA (cytosine38-C5)-methyltransferase
MTLKVLDFYSGIGGFHYALDNIIKSMQIHAFDMNENANEIYKRNFNSQPNSRNILFFPLEYFNDFKADLWLMSPPCQPFTRKGNQRDDDKRTDSLKYLLSILVNMTSKPSKIIIENVLGFEKSLVFSDLIAVMKECNYQYQYFILNSLDFGIPNSRPRLYFIASLTGFTSKFIPNPIPKTRISHHLQHDIIETKYLVPRMQLWKAGAYFDYCFPDDYHSCCFTKAYTRFAKGGGSVLIKNKDLLKESLQKYKLMKLQLDADWAKSNQSKTEYFELFYSNTKCPLEDLKIRYFTPREIARLLGYSDDFILNGSLKSQYKLLGNSMNVVVVECILKYLIDDKVE